MSYLAISHICAQPVYGDKQGKCVLCGIETTAGNEINFSDNFTGYSYLCYGDVLCEYCYGFVKNQQFRYHSWIASKGDIKFLQRNECLDYIINPPDPPFAFYITLTNKKQGWLEYYRQAVNYSKNRYVLLTDFAGVVFVELEEAKKMNDIVVFLREKKMPKAQLLQGEFSISLYKKAIEEGWEEYIVEARKNTKKPLWEVIVNVAK